jgi:hypothetical protein
VGVRGDLILGSITDQTPIVGEDGVVRFTPAVGYDFYTIITPDANATRKKTGRHKGRDQ